MVNKELKFKKSISNKANLYYFMFLANLYTSIGFDWILIGASFFSAISVTLNNFDKVIIASTAAIPGTIVLTKHTFKFDEWANWHCIFSQRLRVLSRKLEFEEADCSQISQYLTDLEQEMESIRPNFINIHFRQNSNFDIKK
jgi:hypothetical protein